MVNDRPHESGGDPVAFERRSFLSRLLGISMVGGLVAAYGTLAAFMARFLYPAHPQTTGWLYVTETARLAHGESLAYRTPGGARVNVARLGRGRADEDFIALSSTCPHLGCQVHWEAQNDRFLCPCHNGVFDPSGVATAGPPAEARQRLPTYPLKVEQDLLYIEVPLEELALGSGQIDSEAGPPGPGHDPVLFAVRSRGRGSGVA